MRCFPRETLQAYFDGELPPAEAKELEKHLGACSFCRERLAEVRSSGEAVRAKFRRLDPARIPAAPPLRGSAALQRAESSSLWRRLSLSSVRLPAAAGAMAALFALGLLLGTSLRGRTKAEENSSSGPHRAPAQISIAGSESVQVLSVGLSLKDYDLIDSPVIFTIKEHKP